MYKGAIRIFKSKKGADVFGTSLVPFGDKGDRLCKLSMSCVLTMYLDRYMGTFRSLKGANKRLVST